MRGSQEVLRPSHHCQGDSGLVIGQEHQHQAYTSPLPCVPRETQDRHDGNSSNRYWKVTLRIVRYLCRPQVFILVLQDRSCRSVTIVSVLAPQRKTGKMVQMLSLAVFCSSLIGLSGAAALGTAEEYADGSIHARIMGMKMVRTLDHEIELD